MAKTIGFYVSENPEIALAICFYVDEEVQKGTELVKKGLSAWGNPKAVEDGEYMPELTVEDATWIYYAGWAEASLELLNRADISYSEIDVAINETGEIIKQNNNDFNWISV